MSNKKYYAQCVLTASVLFIVFPIQTHQAYLRNIQDIVGNLDNLSRSAHSDVENVEVTDEILKISAKSAAELTNAKGPVTGFSYTAEEMEKFKIWPYGIIPYYIDDYSFDTTLTERLRTLLNEVNTLTGLRFMEMTAAPKDDQERWVLFINRRGVLSCEDYTTRSFTTKGVQRVVLGYDCLDEGGGGLAAMVLALAGVPPQHNAPDRDQYVNVVKENIIPEKQHLFQILSDDEWLFHDISYDFLSAGHYNFHKYTVNGGATLVPKEAVTVAVGEGDGISHKDILKIKMLYNYIRTKSPKAKASKCSQLYRPASNFDNFTLKNDDIDLTPRSKPGKYLNAAAIGKEHTQDKHQNFLKKKRNKLEVLADKDTDDEDIAPRTMKKRKNKNRKQKLLLKKRGYKLKHKEIISKLALLSDFNTSNE